MIETITRHLIDSVRRERGGREGGRERERERERGGEGLGGRGRERGREEGERTTRRGRGESGYMTLFSCFSASDGVGERKVVAPIAAGDKVGHTN